MVTSNSGFCFLTEERPIEAFTTKDGQDWTNWEFVKAFDKFDSFESAANYIHDWIKVKKHKASSV